MDKLLTLLEDNAQFTYSQLAAMLDETETEIKKRIEDYKQKGVIKGTSTIIDRSKLQNAGVNAIIEIKVTPKAETGFDETAKIVASFDNVDSVYLAASATFDLIAFVRGANIQEVSSFVAKQLSTLDSVVSTATHFVLTNIKRAEFLLLMIVTKNKGVWSFNGLQ